MFHLLFIASVSFGLGYGEDSNGYCTKDSCSMPDKPNIIILLGDDVGYGDLCVYGHPSQECNGIDRMATEGIIFKQFYSADSMCTPSRAALLTGRLPIRLGMVGGRRVLMDFDTGGLGENEITIGKMLKKEGYSTGMIGKWHLGINKYNRTDGIHLPHNHGFDWVGINLPLSNLWECDETGFFHPGGPENTKCFLYKGDKLYQQPIKFENLTRDLVDDWLKFLDDNLRREKETQKRQPFFFYFSFPHVHSAQFANKEFRGKSARGLYGDNLNEMGWAVEQVLNSLKQNGIHKQTLVIFLSDHGPHRELCSYGGSTGGFKGGKSNSFEGGFRIPAITWMPGTVPNGRVSPAVTSSLDIFPSLAKIVSPGKSIVPSETILDGMDMSEYLLGQKLDLGLDLMDKRPIIYYCNHHLMAVRWREFKIHYYTSPLFNTTDAEIKCPQGMPLEDWYKSQMCPDTQLHKQDPPLIYNLHTDPDEQWPLNDWEHLDLIDRINDLINKHKQSIVDVPRQLGNYNPRVIPCHDFPKCILDNP